MPLRSTLWSLLLFCFCCLGSSPVALGQIDEGDVPDSTEIRVLRQLYFHTQGQGWARRDNWLQLQDSTLQEVDEWYGVTVRFGDVTALQLSNNKLRGHLPSSLGLLTSLQVLNLSSNFLQGTIPKTLKNLAILGELQLSRNQLSGRFPGEFWKLRYLSRLDLSYNQLSGTLPDSAQSPSSLGLLLLRSNRFTGPLPASFKNLPLGHLDLGYNQFAGVLPPQWETLQNLTYLFLPHNQLTGTIPTQWGNMRWLSQLLLEDNQLNGAVPASLTSLPQFYMLTLQRNNLTFLPSWAADSAKAPTIRISGNYLDFGSIQPNFARDGRSYIPNFDYGPQRVRPVDTISCLAGSSQLLHRGMRGSRNHYQWERQIGLAWIDLAGQTDTTLRLNSINPAQAGFYRVRVWNESVKTPYGAHPPLYTRCVYVDVLPYANLSANRPVDAAVPALSNQFARTSRGTVTENVNYVRTYTARVPLTDTTVVLHSTADAVQVQTDYLDGLGRSIQTVLREASPGRHDLVQPVAYDALGRQPRQYLSYPGALASSASAGAYRPDALYEQYHFYRDLPVTGPPSPADLTTGVARTGVAFAETAFEPSPLNRPVVQAAAGESWQMVTGRVTSSLERPNTLPDSIQYYRPGYGRAAHELTAQPGGYAAGELWGTQTTDEQGYRTLSWKNKQGQLILQQAEAKRIRTTDNVGHSRWLRTYYVYDDFDRLRVVLQPEAVREIQRSNGVVTAAAEPFLFRYRYDEQGRQIAKQVPGQEGETLVVFDQLDRPVLSQTPLQRTRQEWSWTKYDALGRIVLSGLVGRSDTLGQGTLQAVAAADTATAQQYEVRTSLTATYPQAYTTDHTFPHLGQQGFTAGQVLLVTYYDDYDFNQDGQRLADVHYNTSTDAQFAAGTAPVADERRTTGLTTRTKARVLGVAEDDPQQAAWLTTTTFYDERARPVQVQTTNARQGLDLLTTQLDFTGKVVQSIAVHQGPSHTPVQVAEFFTYDHTGRLLTTRQQLPGETKPTLLDSVTYNEIGQATRKTLGAGRLKQDVDYAYNIRGWLTALNDPYQPNTQDLFNLSLHYEQGFTAGYEQYNGNLTGQTWRSGRDGVQRAYGYVYDPLNRLLQGDFVARAGGVEGTLSTASPWNAELDNYGMHFVSYDDNGNIVTLRRRGLLQNATHATSRRYGAVDNLRYTYAGNRLQAVDDLVTGNQLPQPASYQGAPTSLAGDFQEAGVQLNQEYRYDANGNLTQDKNKGITHIAYNHLNLPRQIHFGAGADSIVFQYAASGQKVAKLVYQTGKPLLRTDYLGPYQYEQDSLRFFPHAQGRVLRFVSRDGATQPHVRYQREFTFKDHLGNLRLAYRLGQIRTYTASLEQDASTRRRETQQFDSLSVSMPIAVETPHHLTGTHAARLNAGGSTPSALGPMTQLTVQKGDSIKVIAPGHYPEPVSNSNYVFSFASFITGLVQPAVSGPQTGPDGSRRGGLPLLQLGLSAGLTSLPHRSASVPKGYLRVLIFNEDSVLVEQHVRRLSEEGLTSFEKLTTNFLRIEQNGYVTVYVGNESPVDVYFDNIEVEHRQGLQVQENQYDPFGLDLAGVSGAAPGLRLKNFYQFNGKENQLDLGLNWNHQDARFFDYQLGRWHVVDPLLEVDQESWTPYHFGFDNAVRYADADGQFPFATIAIGAAVGAGISAVVAISEGKDTQDVLIAAAGGAVAGAIAGTGAGLIEVLGLGAGHAIAVNAAAGFVGGATQEVVSQSGAKIRDNKASFNTAKIAQNAVIGAVGGAAGGLITDPIKNHAAKAAGAKVAARMTSSTAGPEARQALHSTFQKAAPALRNNNKATNAAVGSVIRERNREATAAGIAAGRAASTAAERVIQAGTEKGSNYLNTKMDEKNGRH